MNKDNSYFYIKKKHSIIFTHKSCPTLKGHTESL